MFDTETKDIQRSVHIPIVGCAAVVACPMPLRQTCDTSRPPERQSATAGTDLGRVGFIDDAKYPAVRNRFVTQHGFKHSPSGIADGLRHFGFLQSGRADIAHHDMSVGSGNFGAFNMQEMPALTGDLRLQPASLPLLVSVLVERELLSRCAEETRMLDLVAIAQGGERLETEVDTDSGTVFGFSVRQFDLDINEPMTITVASNAPGLRNGTLGNFAGQPQSVVAPEKSKGIAVQSCRAFEVGKRNPVEIALGRPEARRFGKTRSACVRKLGADRVNRIGVDAQFARHTTAEIDQIKRGGALDAHAGSPARSRNSICLAAEIPDEIYRPRLRSERAANSLLSVLDAKSVCEDHSEGRLSGNAETRFRDHGARQTPVIPINLANICPNIKGAAFLSGLNAGVSSRNML